MVSVRRNGGCMNIQFTILAAETFFSKAEKAEREGKLSYAKDNYKLAAAKYREVAGGVLEKREHFLALARECEEKAEHMGTISAPPAEKPRQPRSSSSSAPSAEDNNRVPSSSAGEGVPDYSGYELNFASPNEQVSFDDIIGLEKAKTAIHRKLIYPLSDPETYRRYHLKPGGNILLEGPPGTGKTTFAKAAACEVNLPFIIVDCNALVDCYIGNTGKNIDKLFAEVRRFVKEQNTAVILFCDEFDSIAKARTGDDKTAAEAVPSLIRQLDGFDTDNANIIILAATNIKEALDPAILSRFSNNIFIPLPDEIARRLIFESKLKKCGISDADLRMLDLTMAAKVSEGMSGRDINHIVTEFSEMLAERDAGIQNFPDTLQNVLLRLIQERRG